MGLSDNSAGLRIMCNDRGSAERMPYSFSCFLKLKCLDNVLSCYISFCCEAAYGPGLFLPPFSHITKTLAVNLNSKDETFSTRIPYVVEQLQLSSCGLICI